MTARRARPGVTSPVLEERAAEAVEALARGAGARRDEVLAMRAATEECARFLEACRPRRAYAQAVAVESGGVRRPMVLVKVELSGRGVRRTVLWKGGPLAEQLLRRWGWPLPWAEALASALSQDVAVREAEVWAGAAGMVEALRGDPGAAGALRERVDAMRSKERSRQEGELRELSKALVRGGWTEADVLRVWREEQCRDVQET